MDLGSKKKLLEKINTALDEVRPHLAVDGGNIEVVDVTDEGIVKIKWLGTCETCSMSAMTMKAGVEETIKSKIKGIKGVVAVNGAFTSELPSV
ncbi:MAG TPA: NifU family protein [Bacteroidales bacterium]|nr:NifU family protein [Bacteroidales bacterium]